MTTTKPTLRFALFGNVYQHAKSAAVAQVIECLQQRGAELFIDEEYYDFLRCSELITPLRAKTFADRHFDVDFAISMGGDGTFLKTAGRVGDKAIPILGVNMGRLGFLADVTAREVEACITALYEGDYSVEERSLIRVAASTAQGDGHTARGEVAWQGHALNDVAILKRDTASMITIRAEVNGEYLATYQADGLIVSTPTGSTAYSLSNGGPIIVPGTNVMLMTAVAPHSLNIRPIVLPDTAQITLAVSSRSHTFLVAVDGQSEKLPEGTTLHLGRADYKVRVVKRAGTRYFTTLREKMMWGADVR